MHMKPVSPSPPQAASGPRELVQVSLPGLSGSIKATFVDLSSDGPAQTTVADLVQLLLLEDGPDIVQELQCYADGRQAATTTLPGPECWSLQRAIISQPNRKWTDAELLELSASGSPLDATIPLASVVPSSNTSRDRPNLPARMFSDFALTAHLQVPLIRLVYLPFQLEITFRHIPEIPEGFTYPWFTARETTAADVVEGLLDEHGIRKLVTQGSKSARVEYTLTVNDEVLLPTAQVIAHLQSVSSAGPPYEIQFSISEAWFARIGTVAKSFSRALQRPGIGSRSPPGSRTAIATQRPRSPEEPPSSTTASAWRPASIFGSLWTSPPASLITQQGTVKAVGATQAGQAATEAGEEDAEEGEGTLKGIEQAMSHAKTLSPQTTGVNGAPASSSRLSSLFDAWRQPEPAAAALPSASPLVEQSTVRARMVSEPVMADDFKRASQLILDPAGKLGLGLEEGSEGEGDDGGDPSSESLVDSFEALMKELGIKDAQKAAMRMLDDDRKRFLIAQQRQAASGAGSSASTVRPVRATRTGPEPSRKSTALVSASSVESSTSRQRFSLAGMGWSSASLALPSPTISEQDVTPRIERKDPFATPPTIDTSASAATSEAGSPVIPAPLLQTATGWSSWFSAGSPAKLPERSAGALARGTHASRGSEAKDTPAFYISQINSGKVVQTSLVKHLIALRVRLATAQLSWIKDFLDNSGIEALEGLLKRITTTSGGVGSKRVTTLKEDSSELDESMQIECIKCLRVLMNAEAGFDRVLGSSNVITYITYSLHTHSLKLQSHVADVLAALCILSVTSGHAIVLAAFSDFKVNYNESFRFEYLVSSIAVPDHDGASDAGAPDEEQEDEAGLWEYRAAGMALINALVNGPNDLEDRIALRDEFARRGLNEVMTTLRYTSPPDALLTQLQVYTEERQDDQEELHERQRTRRLPAGESAQPGVSAYAELVELAERFPEHYSALLEHTKQYLRICGREVDDTFRQQLLRMLATFVDTLLELDDFESSWGTNMSAFLLAIEDIVGKQALVTSSRNADTANVPTSFLDELETLRKKVEELSDERASLKEQLEEKTALGNTLKSLPLPDPSAPETPVKGDKGNVSGVIQRLVQKEKEVLKLQAEVTKLSASKGRSEDAEAAKKERAERNRQWANLMEEIAKNKAQLADQEAMLESREKENKYLKRALESVYTRFQATMDGQAGAGGSGHVSEASSANIDAELIVSRTIETLAQRDAEIRELKEAIDKLKKELQGSLSARPLPPPTTPSQVAVEAIIPATAKAPIAASSTAPRVPLPPLPPPPPPIGTSPSPPIAANGVTTGTTAMQSPAAPAPPPAPLRSMSINGFAANIRVARPAPKPPTHPAAAMPVSHPAQGALGAPAPPPPPPPPPSIGLGLPHPGILHRSVTLPLPPKSPGFGPSAAGGVPLPPPPPPAPGAAGISRPPLPFAGAIRGAGSGPAPPAPPSVITPTITLQRKATRPTKKMKPFFWQKIAPQAAAATVWSSLETDSLQLDLTELEAAFSAESKDKPLKALPGDGPGKPKVTSLLPISRAQNIAIMLARMRISHAAIRDAILQIDDKKMTIDRLKALRSFVPSSDEVKNISSYTGDFAALSASDQYFRTIIVIPRFGERLTCMMTRRRFEMDLEELRPELSILRNATDELRASTKFKTVLQIVLAVGNTLNAATFRGNAQGFQLEALLKLKDTRATITAPGATAGTATLLHYVARLLMKQSDGLINFLSESPHVQAASRVSAATVAASVSAVTNAISAVRAELDIMKRLPTSSPIDRFVPVMEYFVAEAEPAILALTAMSVQLDTDLWALLEYFGEDPATAKPEDVFTTVASFSLALQLAEEDILDEERKLAKSSGAKGKGKTDLGLSASGRKVSDGKRSIGRGGFDKALRDIKSGTAVRRQRQEGSTSHRPQSRIFLDGARR